MRHLIYISFILTFSFSLEASDYNYKMEGIGTATTKNMILSNGTKYLLYENNIGWTDNLGNYGKSFCFGRIKIIDKITDKFNLICESIDQNENKNWVEFSRVDTNMDAGAGRSKYIDGTGIYKNFIGAECIFSTKYLKDSLFFKSKCKIDPAVVKKMAGKL